MMLKCVAGGIIFSAGLTSAQALPPFTFDGEDPCFRVASGFALDKSVGFLGSFKFSATGPSTNPPTAVGGWDIDTIPDGEYAIDFYCDTGNYASDAEYIVESVDGLRTLTRSQNYVSVGWHTLGTFNIKGAVRFTQTNHWSGTGTKVIADAMRSTLLTEPTLLPPEETVPQLPPTEVKNWAEYWRCCHSKRGSCFNRKITLFTFGRGYDSSEPAAAGNCTPWM